jgi:uncharacterized protein YkwD
MHKRGAVTLLCLVPLAGVAGSGAHAATTTCEDADLVPAGDNVERVSASVSCLINAARSDGGSPPLKASARLRDAAQGMSDLMVQQSFFSHDTPDGRTLPDRVRPTGYLPSADVWLLGENLGWGSGALATPRAIVGGWMNSSEHRANMLAADYEDLGVGVTVGSPSAADERGATYTTDFGTRDARPAVTVPKRVTANRDRAGSEGISYSAGCSRPCRLVARLFLDARAATAARGGPSRRVLLGTGRLRLRLGGTATLTVPLSARGETALRRLVRPSLVLVTEAVGTPGARTTRVTLE